MTLNEILNMTGWDLNRLTRPELEAVRNKLMSITKNRLNNFRKAHLQGVSPAYHLAHAQGLTGNQKLSKNMSKAQLKQSITSYKQFINKKTSTVTGTRKFIRKTVGSDLMDALRRMHMVYAFWQVYSSLKEAFAIELADSTLSSEQIMREIRKTWKDYGGFMNWQEWEQKVFERLERKVDKIYTEYRSE